MSVAVAARMEELYTSVVAPLVLGGELRPVRPVGPRLAREMAAMARAFQTSDDGLSLRVREARGRRARALLAVENAPRLGGSDWIIGAAFNDLLQVANPHLRSVVAPQRARTLLAATEATMSMVSPPRDLAAAVGRHATFASSSGLVRHDTVVRWWTGSATFRGEEPPPRLLVWPSVRRVRTETVTSTLRDLAAHTDVGDERYARAVGIWLSLSPLSDLSASSRDEPPFAWSRGTLSLIRSPLGAATARRALSGAGPRAELALERAARALPAGDERSAVETFLDARREHAALSP